MAFLTVGVPLYIIVWLWDAHDNGEEHAQKEMEESNWGCGLITFLVGAFLIALLAAFISFIKLL